MIKNSVYSDDEELLSQFRAGNEKALNLVFKRFYNRLCIYTTQFTNDSDSAEEISVDAFQKLWDRRTEFFNLQALKSFLYVCSRNAALNYIDKKQRRVKRLFSFFDSPEPIEEPAINNIIYAEVWNEIQKEINALPEQCSKIIKLLFEMDMTADEVAKEMNISRNTVYSQKFRGLAILKKRLSSAHFALLIASAFLHQ